MANENVEYSENIDLVRGDAKTAIKKLAIPMILSMLIMMVYNVVDSIWVSGLGADALAALGFITPIYTIVIGFGNGIGAGVNSLIARYIGAADFEKGGNAGMHSIVLSIVLSIFVPIIILLFLKDILILMGASSVLDLTLQYGYYIIIGSFSFLGPGIIAAIFRAEGDIKRSMIPLVVTAVLNMILDPIFIYTLNMQMAGAAIATVLSGTVGLLMMLYWIFVKKDTYLTLNRQIYNRSMEIYKDILIVGIPASIEQLIMSALTIIVNSLLVIVSGTTAVAVYTATWRLMSIGVIPTIGIATAAMTVAGAAYGAKNWNKLNTACSYSVRLGFIISLIITVLLFIFADYIAVIFAYSSTSQHLAPLIANAIRILCFYILPIPFGATAGNIFQGLGKGPMSLSLTAIRALFCTAIFATLFGLIFGLGENGVYWGIVIGDIIGSLIAYSVIKLYIKKIKGHWEKAETTA